MHTTTIVDLVTPLFTGMFGWGSTYNSESAEWELSSQCNPDDKIKLSFNDVTITVKFDGGLSISDLTERLKKLLSAFEVSTGFPPLVDDWFDGVDSPTTIGSKRLLALVWAFARHHSDLDASGQYFEVSSYYVRSNDTFVIEAYDETDEKFSFGYNFGTHKFTAEATETALSNVETMVIIASIANTTNRVLGSAECPNFGNDHDVGYTMEVGTHGPVPCNEPCGSDTATSTATATDVADTGWYDVMTKF